MAVNVIDTIKPKNGGNFPIVEAIDVLVSDGLRLSEALFAKVDTATLIETAEAIGEILNSLQQQIDQIEISASAEAIVAPEVAGARVGADGTSYETLKERLDAENNKTSYTLTHLPFVNLADSANVLLTATKHENVYIPRITDGYIVVEERSGYCYYEVPIPENKAATIRFKKQSHMETGQQLVIVDNTGKSYVTVGYNAAFSQSYFKESGGYVSILLANLLSRTTYAAATKILICYTDEDVHECYVEAGRSAETLKDAIFPYGKAGLPFVGSADFSDGQYSKVSIRNAIASIKLNVKGYKKPFVKGFYWETVNESIILLIGAEKDGASSTLCSFRIPASSTGQQTFESLQSVAHSSQPIGTVVLDVSKINPSEITTRNMNSHDYTHFGIADSAFTDYAEIVPPVRFYGMAGLTTEWFLQNCLNESIDNVFIRYKETVEAHYNSNYDRRHTWMRPVNEARGNGNVEYYASYMDGREDGFVINYLRASVNGLANRTVKALFIGDSLIDNGYTVKEISSLFEADAAGARIQFYGTRGDAPYLHEGRSGWSTYDVLHTTSYNNRDNAFINPSTGSFDFEYYCTTNSIPELDFIAIQLGVNDVFRPMEGTTTVGNLEAMIESIHAYMPDVKILLATPPQPYLGGKYDCLNFRPAEYAHRYRLEIAKDIINKYKSGYATTKVYVISIHSVVDTFNDFTMNTRPVNADSEELESYCSDITHYRLPGHKKVARQYYAAMKYIE